MDYISLDIQNSGVILNTAKKEPTIGVIFDLKLWYKQSTS